MASREGTAVHQILQFVGCGEPANRGESLPMEGQAPKGGRRPQICWCQLEKARGMEAGEAG